MKSKWCSTLGLCVYTEEQVGVYSISAPYYEMLGTITKEFSTRTKRSRFLRLDLIKRCHGTGTHHDSVALAHELVVRPSIPYSNPYKYLVYWSRELSQHAHGTMYSADNKYVHT